MGAPSWGECQSEESMSQPTEKDDPRITPPKKYAERQQSPQNAPKAGRMQDDTADAAGARDDIETDAQDESVPTSTQDMQRSQD